MAMYRKCWLMVSILSLLLVAACGTAPQQSNQARQTSTPLPATATAIKISLPGQPTSLPTAQATPRKTILSPPPTATPTQTSSGGQTSQEQQLAQYVFGLINHDRVAQGLAPYTWSSALAGGAHLHSLRMVAYGQLSHQCPGEASLGTRITSDGLVWRSAGENIGWSNNPNPQQGVLSNHQAMMAERPPNDGHRLNILSASFTLVGIDVVIDSHHGIWLTEDFAQV